MKTKFLLLMFILLGLANNISAQSDGMLSENDKKEMQNKAKQRIDDFLNYLGAIGSKQVSRQRKQASVESALDLFIGNGDPYTYEDDYGNRLQHAAVTMQTTNKYGRKYPPKPMKTYLSALMSLPYNKVVIESADAVRVDNIQEEGNGKYKAVAYYYQKFTGSYGDGRIYSDYTQKKVTIYVERTLLDTIDGEKTVWTVLLGDVSAVETR